MTGCRMLRWKDLYSTPYAPEVALADAAARNDVPYSCLRTCQPWGPDDAPAAPETCGPHRSCWAAPRSTVA